MKTLTDYNQFRKHLDEWGLLAEYPWEGGDSACETFAALIIENWIGHTTFLFTDIPLQDAYTKTAEALINKPSGLWRRHSARDSPRGTDYWASEWNRGTRDNGTAAFISTIVFGDHERFTAIYSGFNARRWFCGNTFIRNTWSREEDHTLYGAKKRQPFDPTPTFPDYAGALKSIAYRSPWINKRTWFYDIFCCLIPAYLVRREVNSKHNKGNHLNSWLRINFCYRRKSTWISRWAFRVLPPDLHMENQFGDKTRAAKRNPPMHLLVEGYQNFMDRSLI